MDLTLLKSLMSGDERLVAHFVSIFKMQVPNQIGMLAGLCENEEWEELSTAFHSLKTQFSYVGMAGFAEQMRALEESIDNGETHSIHSRLTDFIGQFNRFWATEFSDGQDALT